MDHPKHPIIDGDGNPYADGSDYQLPIGIKTRDQKGPVGAPDALNHAYGNDLNNAALSVQIKKDFSSPRSSHS